MAKIAIIGTGVAGLGVAYQLRECAELTLFEQDNRVGGHTNTVEVEENGKPIPIDTGFIVFNKVTYPHLTRLFEELSVAVKPSEMSFSVQHTGAGLEYNGMSVPKLFAQKRNYLRPSFYVLVAQILRFFRVAQASLQDESQESLTVEAFCQRHGLGRDFLNYYLIPMSSAVWSTEPTGVLEFPARSLIRFFHNHGFLGVTSHHPWFTVDGGAKRYVEKILALIPKPRIGDPVIAVEETDRGVRVQCASGDQGFFDKVVLACHGDQALRLLAKPDPEQSALLGEFRYQRNHATLHTDATVMPSRRAAWASWNYRVTASGEAQTHYWMNALQGVSDSRNYFVSINAEGQIPKDKILYETLYDHPLYTLGAMQAQKRLPGLNQRRATQGIYFCGSYFRYGFHEDAYGSAVDLAKILREHLQVK